MSKPSIFSIKGSELSLSGDALIGLLQAVLDKGVPFRFQAKGYSMLPFIGDGDVITVSPLSDASLHLGNVVAFVYPETGKLAVHRIVGRVRGALLIKGDNMFDADGFIPRSRILGCVTRVERNGKKAPLGLGVERNGKKVPLGLGLERILIAFLIRRRPFFPSLLPIWRIIRPIVRRRIS